MYGVPRSSAPPRRRKRLRRALTIAIAGVAVLVVVLLILIADGVLVLPGHTSSPVTISYLQVRVIEGNTSAGMPWFGVGSTDKSYYDGYPLQVAPGSTFHAALYFYNYDNVTHSLLSVQASTIPTQAVPVTSTTPSVPLPIPPSPESIEGQNFVVYVTIPSTPGATYVLTLTIGAIPTP